jgi:hypothetical protein
MKVRSVLIAVVLSCGLTALSEAKTLSPAAASHAKAMASARKRSKQQGKARIKAVSKRSNIKRAKKRTVRH